MLEFRDPLGRTASEIAFAVAEALFRGDEAFAELQQIGDRKRWQIGCGNDYWFYDLGEGNFRLVYRYADSDSLAKLRTLLKDKVGVRVAD